MGEAQAEAHRYLEMLELDGKSNQTAASLTLPDRKRLEVARALATRPKLLLLDEVMAGLTPSESTAMVELLRQVRERGITLLVIEHVMQIVIIFMIILIVMILIQV